MANPISPELKIGTIGELLVQLRLLQYGVQAAAPLKDSGNDLIALKGFAIRCIQVKTSTNSMPAWPPTEKHYHLLALVKLIGHDHELDINASKVYLLSKEELPSVTRAWDRLNQYELTSDRVAELFNEESRAN
jgi:hypothetical protein